MQKFGQVVAAGGTVLIDNRAKLRIARDIRVAIRKVTVHAGRKVVVAVF